MKTWRYAMPLICWLIHGRDMAGEVTARTKAEARAEIKRRLRIDRVPPRTLIREK